MSYTKLITPAILFIEGLVYIYRYFFPRSFFGSSFLEIAYAVIFFALAFWTYRSTSNRFLNYLVIIFSFLFGPGSFLGLGLFFGFSLAVSAYLQSRSKKI